MESELITSSYMLGYENKLKTLDPSVYDNRFFIELLEEYVKIINNLIGRNV